MRYFLAFYVVCVVAVVAILGCRGTHFRKPPLYIYPDMERQPKLRPQTPNGFFASGMSSQLPVPGTVARTKPILTVAGAVEAYQSTPVTTGRTPGTTNFIELNPMPVNAAVLKRGQQRYTISCSPCHGQLGDGNGITKKIGAMAVVANLHDKRIVQLPDGELFEVITHGRNLMGAYGPTVPVEDRWAIISYVRALQLSALGTVEDVPEPLRAKLTQ